MRDTLATTSLPEKMPQNLTRESWPPAATAPTTTAVRGLFSLLAILTAAPVSLAPATAFGREPALIAPDGGPEGQPKIVLDRLVVPLNTPEKQRVTRVLEKVLKHEARRVEWGAGRNSRITYRFYLEQLDLSVEHGVLMVRCTALGRLPKGKTARSKLEFGGDPREARKVIDHVLTIVARGVLSRLAELEQDRRTRK
jgi:hypothetical protein